MKTPLGDRERGTMPTKGKSSKRELIDTGRDKRFVRRDEKGRFHDVVDVGRSLSQPGVKQRPKFRQVGATEVIKNHEGNRIHV